VPALTLYIGNPIYLVTHINEQYFAINCFHLKTIIDSIDGITCNLVWEILFLSALVLQVRTFTNAFCFLYYFSAEML
jgi:hypothetical protein